MTHSLAQNGSLKDLHFHAKGRFCPDKNDCGNISWEFTAGQGEKPAHPKSYWILETHLSIRESNSTNNPELERVYLHSSGWRFGLQWVTNKWLWFGSCGFSPAPTDGCTAIIYLGLIFGALCSAWLHHFIFHLWGNSIYMHQPRQDCSSSSWTEEKTLFYSCILIKATRTCQDREWSLHPIPPCWEGFDSWTFAVCFHSSVNLAANIQREQRSRGCPGWSRVLLQPPTTWAGFVFLCLLTTISCPVQMSRSNKHSLGGWARQRKQSVTGTAWTLRALVPLQGRVLPLLSCMCTWQKSRLWTGWENIWEEVAPSPGTQEAQSCCQLGKALAGHG